MKIGIMSVFQVRTQNYGNHLQAYALNYYLNKIMRHDAWTICMKNSIWSRKPRFTSVYVMVCRVLKKIFRINKKVNKRPNLEKRYQRFVDFSEKYIKYVPDMNWDKLRQTDYDCFIVGSDIVWCQVPGLVWRANFLDFNTKKKIKKIAYAASFGKDWIPRENRRYIRKKLRDYECISVRENSTVAFLEELRLAKAVHVLDPTLLLSAYEWSQIEENPKPIEQLEANERYAFVYLLAADENVYKDVEKICNANDLKIVFIPNMCGMPDESFGDIQIPDCSPPEWIWLVHHAELILTDSFHGIVFSTIFNKKFLAVDRKKDVELNNRVTDFLALIKQKDKQLSIWEGNCLDDVLWDYKLIEEILEEKKKNSKKYLEDALS